MVSNDSNQEEMGERAVGASWYKEKVVSLIEPRRPWQRWFRLGRLRSEGDDAAVTVCSEYWRECEDRLSIQLECATRRAVDSKLQHSD